MISIGSGRCKAEFQVADEHLNRTGGLHGGFTSCLVETVSSEIVVSRENCPFCVSVDIQVTFLKGARKGDEIVIDARTIRAGRSFVFLECELRHKRDDSIIARGTHTVYFPAEQKK